jgi:tRNA pseudouridine38-40 synthase
VNVNQQNRQLATEMPDESSSSGIFRYALGVEYRGTHYSGWQRQNSDHCGSGLKTVQASLEDAISIIANEPVSTICAGRTDTGVHAREQVVHFDTYAVRPDRAWVLGVNTQLPDDISVHWVKQVTADFHARFSATARTYRYFINNQAGRPALSREHMTSIWRPLDHEAMHQAAQYLLGSNDFSSFRGSSCQSKSPVRLIHTIEVQRSGAVVVMQVKANAFLHHMVRNIMGVLIKIGCGEKPVTWMKEVVEAKARTSAGITAPANGLYLLKVDYPEIFGLPQLNIGALEGKGSFELVLANNLSGADFC